MIESIIIILLAGLIYLILKHAASLGNKKSYSPSTKTLPDSSADKSHHINIQSIDTQKAQSYLNEDVRSSHISENKVANAPQAIEQTYTDISRDDDGLVEIPIASEQHKHSTLPTPPKSDPPNPYAQYLRPEVKVPVNKSAWISPGETVKVSSIIINGGFFYFGQKLKSLDGYSPEPALIDPSLYVQAAPMLYEDESLGYWPSYSSISSRCRGAYLTWLASERSNPDVPLGYVFIYLYGLERRVTIDNPESQSHLSSKGAICNAEELELIFHEVKRLRNIYGNSNSFYRYSTRLLELVCIFASRQGKELDLEIEDSINSNLFRYKVGLEVYNGRPLPSGLAFAWINNHPEYRLKTPARRCFSLFKELFILKYQHQFGEGMKITPNKTLLRITPNLSSASLRAIKSIKLDFPDATILTGPLKKLLAIAEECNQELEPYSRYLGKAGTTQDDIPGLLLLPDALFANTQPTPVLKLKEWMYNTFSQNNIIHVSELWTQMGLPPPAKFNKNENDLIVKLMDKLQTGFAPDPRYHHSKIQSDGILTIYPVNAPEARLEKASKAFDELLLVLKLGAIISSADGSVADEERDFLFSMVRNDPLLEVADRYSLEAFLDWQLKTPSSLTTIKNKLNAASQQEKTAICTVMVSLVLADGKVESKEIKQLESIYAALGLDKSTVSSDIHRIATSGTALNKTAESHEIKFDDEIVKLHENETKDVQAMLHAIFAEDEPSVEDSESENSADNLDDISSSDPTSSLATQYRALLETLITRQQWSRSDFKAFCDSYNLMVNDVIEVINDWAYELVGAPLVEEDNDVTVDQEIMEEIRQSEN